MTDDRSQMRVPVEATDPDVVLFDCRAEIERQHSSLACALADAINEAREMGLGEQGMIDDDIKALRADLSSGNAAMGRVFSATPDRTTRLLDELERLRAELAEAQRDAERWRYARMVLCTEEIENAHSLALHSRMNSDEEAAKADDAIDAARGAG